MISIKIVSPILFVICVTSDLNGMLSRTAWSGRAARTASSMQHRVIPANNQIRRNFGTTPIQGIDPTEFALFQTWKDQKIKDQQYIHQEFNHFLHANDESGMVEFVTRLNNQNTGRLFLLTQEQLIQAHKMINDSETKCMLLQAFSVSVVVGGFKWLVGRQNVHQVFDDLIGTDEFIMSAFIFHLHVHDTLRLLTAQELDQAYPLVNDTTKPILSAAYKKYQTSPEKE